MKLTLHRFMAKGKEYKSESVNSAGRLDFQKRDVDEYLNTVSVSILAAI